MFGGLQEPTEMTGNRLENGDLGIEASAEEWKVIEQILLAERAVTKVLLEEAVAAEREACAKVAELYRREKGMLLHIRGESPETIWETACGSIMGAIRERDEGPREPREAKWGVRS